MSNLNDETPTVVTPFELPLTHRAMEAALRTGHGRALMHVTCHGTEGVEDLILQACVHNQAYDAQLEGDRADWMVEMVDAAGLQAELQPQILGSLKCGGSSADFWGVNQQCRIALILARRGDEQSRTALYSACKKQEKSADIIACEEIIELDGADGLIFVAERAGQWITDDRNTFVGDSPLSFYDEQHGSGSAERILRVAAEGSRLIALYMDHLDSDDDEAEFVPGQGTIKCDIIERFGAKKSSRFESIRAWNGEDIVRDIVTTDVSSNSNPRLYRRWGMDASDHDLRIVAEAMFAEQNEDRLWLYLYVFLHHGLPEFDLRILSLAECDDPDVRALTNRVLSEHSHVEVRRLAIARIREGRLSESTLTLLCKNYREGDWGLIESVLRLPDDRDELHELFLDLGSVFECNGLPESRDPLMLVYEHSPSALCRNRSVEALFERGLAPDWLLKECRFDVDEDTRDLASLS